MFVVLDTSGNVVRICADTLLQFPVKSKQYSDMIFVPKDINTAQPYVLCKTVEDETGVSHIQLHDTYPCKYLLK